MDRRSYGMVSRQTIQDFLHSQGVMPVDGAHTADENYVFPSEKWVKETFSKAHESLKSSLSSQGANVKDWNEESYDCDDFTRFSSAYAAVLHRITSNREKNTALVFGDFWYVQDAGGSHAINFTIVAGEAGKPRLLFFEPQDSQVVKLSKKEIESCTALRW